MDLTTLIGLIAGLAVVVLGIQQSGSIVTFIDLPSVFVTVGGSICATIICFPLNELVGVIGVAKKTVFTKAPPVSETIATLVSFAERARREGILALERHMEEIEDEFLSKGIQLAVEGQEPNLIPIP